MSESLTLEQALHAGRPGWASVVQEIWQKVHDAGGIVSHVGTRGGELIMTYRGTDAETVRAIFDISQRTHTMCEVCGQGGTRQGWHVRCAQHPAGGSENA